MFPVGRADMKHASYVADAVNVSMPSDFQVAGHVTVAGESAVSSWPRSGVKIIVAGD